MKNLFAISCFGSSGGCFARSFFLKNSFKNKLKNFAKNQLAIIFAASLAMMGMVSEGWAAASAQANAACNTSGTDAQTCTAGLSCTAMSGANVIAGTGCSSNTNTLATVCACKISTGQPCSGPTDGNSCFDGTCGSSAGSGYECGGVSGFQAAKNFQNTVDNNSLVTVLCKAYLLANGTAGKTIAAFAIISAGIGFFTGKVSWGLLIGISIGIGTMFGAPSIVAAISGSSYDTSSCRTATGVYDNGRNGR